MNKKNKYEMKPEDNYGNQKNYDIIPQRNVPARVYGVKRVNNNNSSKTDELKNINDMYEFVKSNNYQYTDIETNTLIRLINQYTVNTIKNYEIDLFWSESARNILKIIIIIDLINYNKISKEKIVEQLKNIDELKKYLLDNADKLANSEFREVKMNTQTISSDKPFESAIQLIKKAYET